jgi:hypothetical protein
MSECAGHYHGDVNITDREVCFLLTMNELFKKLITINVCSIIDVLCIVKVKGKVVPVL